VRKVIATRYPNIETNIIDDEDIEQEDAFLAASLESR
jgi:hypothetical protein